jgi:cytochrome c-type biogenesis protein
MLPVYISYFAGGEDNSKKTLRNAFGFVLGFSIVFISLGAFAGSIGSLLREHKMAVNVVSGLIVMILGLNFMGVFRIKILNTTKKLDVNINNTGFFRTVLFGIVFSIGWTPCVGAFLGSALMLASQRGSSLQGIVMLVLYSAGLGIPFIVSAILIDKLKSTFLFIKTHYRIINLIAGVFLVLTGLLMMTGTFGYMLSAIGSGI